MERDPIPAPTVDGRGNLLARSIVLGDMRAVVGAHDATRGSPDERADDELRTAYEEHHVALFKFCLVLVGEKSLAEELVAETFVRVAPRLQHIQMGQVRSYLRKVAVNLWKNQLRRRRLEGRAQTARAHLGADAGITFEERDSLWSAVLRLPVKQRACVVLRYYEDLPERAVADILGCSVGSVKSNTSKALMKLREWMTSSPPE